MSDTPYPIGDETRAAYDRALAAEPGLRAAVDVVDALTALVRPGDELCFGCVWETIVKPTVTPHVGWSRGHVPEQAADPDPGGLPMPVDLSELFAWDDRREEAMTETERWLRTPEAYDAVSDVLLARLYDADPANGCGIRRGVEQGSPA